MRTDREKGKKVFEILKNFILIVIFEKIKVLL